MILTVVNHCLEALHLRFSGVLPTPLQQKKRQHNSSWNAQRSSVFLKVFFHYHLFYYLLLRCSKTNLRPVLRGQPHSSDANSCVISFKFKTMVTGSFLTFRFFTGISVTPLLICQCDVQCKPILSVPHGVLEYAKPNFSLVLRVQAYPPDVNRYIYRRVYSRSIFSYFDLKVPSHQCFT